MHCIARGCAFFTKFREDAETDSNPVRVTNNINELR